MGDAAGPDLGLEAVVPARRLGSRFFVGQTVDACGFRKARDRKLTEIAPAAAADAGKAFRGHHRATEPARDLFQPRRQIDRRADAGEVEPVAAADIAVENSSDMQRDAEAKPFYGVADRILQIGDTGARLMGGFEHMRADLPV